MPIFVLHASNKAGTQSVLLHYAHKHFFPQFKSLLSNKVECQGAKKPKSKIHLANGSKNNIYQQLCLGTRKSLIKVLVMDIINSSHLWL